LGHSLALQPGIAAHKHHMHISKSCVTHAFALFLVCINHGLNEIDVPCTTSMWWWVQMMGIDWWTEWQFGSFVFAGMAILAATQLVTH